MGYLNREKPTCKLCGKAHWNIQGCPSEDGGVEQEATEDQPLGLTQGEDSEAVPAYSDDPVTEPRTVPPGGLKPWGKPSMKDRSFGPPVS